METKHVLIYLAGVTPVLAIFGLIVWLHRRAWKKTDHQQITTRVTCHWRYYLVSPGDATEQDIVRINGITQSDGTTYACYQLCGSNNQFDDEDKITTDQLARDIMMCAELGYKLRHHRVPTVQRGPKSYRDDGQRAISGISDLEILYAHSRIDGFEGAVKCKEAGGHDCPVCYPTGSDVESLGFSYNVNE